MIRPSEWPSSSERKSNDRRTTKCAIRIASGVIGAARATMALEVGDKRAKQFVIRARSLVHASIGTAPIGEFVGKRR